MRFPIFCALLLAGCATAPSPIATPTPQIPKEVVVSPEPSSSPSPVEPAPVVEPEEPAPEELIVGSFPQPETMPLWANPVSCAEAIGVNLINQGSSVNVQGAVASRSFLLPASETGTQEVRHLVDITFTDGKVTVGACTITRDSDRKISTNVAIARNDIPDYWMHFWLTPNDATFVPYGVPPNPEWYDFGNQ